MKIFNKIVYIACFLSISGCMVVNTKSTSKLVNEDLKGFVANTKMSISSSNFSGPVVINGDMTGSGTKFDALTVNGKLDLSRSSVNKFLMANGISNLNQMTIKGSTQLSGESVVKDSDLEELVFASRLLTVSNSNIKTIKVGNVKNSTVKLNKGTTVHGDVVFVNPGGKLLLEDGAKVKGRIYVDRNGVKDYLEIKMQKNLWDQNTKLIDLDTVSEKVNQDGKYVRYSK